MDDSRETIVALSSGIGAAAIAVLRASGPGVRFGVQTVAGRVPPPRQAKLATFRDVAGDPIDKGLLLYFEGPKSETGEDMAEFHLHGGRAIVSAMLDRLTALPGWRLAGRGEFTRRAVENGKIDLTAAEGIADLVAAETSAQRRQAYAQAEGSLERAAAGWRNALVRVMALAEAEIDFPDEGDVPALMAAVRREAGAVKDTMLAALANAKAGERLREGALVVIAGPPNAGKSTLLNALARRDAAIVSPIPGTTRDAIEVRLELDGYPVTLMDTAGLRETQDAIEELGIERTRRHLQEADIVLWLTPAGDVPMPLPASGPLCVPITTMIDRLDSAAERSSGLRLSAVTGEGMSEFAKVLSDQVAEALAGGEASLVTRARHRTAIEAACLHLDRAISGIDSAPELIAEDLRLALREIGRLTGSVDIDEVYDVIFRQFCIGK